MKKELPNTHQLLIWILRAISIVGIGMLSYLAKLHFTQGGEGAICELGEGLSCEVVNTSAYSEVLGIPVAFLGIGYFLLILFLSFRLSSKKETRWKLILLATLFSLPPSLYLSGLELFVIKSICVFCEISKILMIIILGVSFWILKKEDKLPDRGTVFIVLGIGIFAAAQTWYLQARTLKQANYSNLAQCMTENGVVMYGSITCAACKKQKNTFGSSFQYIKDIECNPRGPNPQPELCLEKNISGTPTWIREENGEETKRLVGYQKPERLAAFANCEKELQQDKEQ